MPALHADCQITIGECAPHPLQECKGALPGQIGGGGIILPARVAVEAVVRIVDMRFHRRIGIGLRLDEGIHAIHRDALVAFAEMRQYRAMGDQPRLRGQLATIVGHRTGEPGQTGGGSPGQ